MFGRVNGAAHNLIAGCETMLRGQSAESIRASGHPVPPWAWMNLLAHAGEDVLRYATTARTPRLLRLSDPWQRACSYLAGEILDAAAHHGSLRSLQREVLVPLELELLVRPVSSPRAAGRWAARVLAALDDHRSMQARP